LPNFRQQLAWAEGLRHIVITAGCPRNLLFYFAAMHLDDTLGDGQPQAGAALLASDRIVGLLKLLKELGLVGGGDARSCITH
jgi:hypothetical protein